jgi:hypothetical protein
METDQLIIVWVLAIGFSIAIGKLIYSWYAEISTRNKKAEITNRLLTLLARKSGATEEEIKEAWRV